MLEVLYLIVKVKGIGLTKKVDFSPYFPLIEFFILIIEISVHLTMVPLLLRNKKSYKDHSITFLRGSCRQKEAEESAHEDFKLACY